ncbi:MAG: class I mannose-6-phosphate isomerase [Clostridia bacterium]|nr:class I mannose-6-phosphate isomerase [Clostridia bacterium]
MKLSPVLKDYIWGGYRLKELFGRDNGGKKISESWEVSVHADGLSSCLGGTLSDYLRENPRAVNKQGGHFPVLIKYIDAKQNLSVQVHPDDGYARRVEGDNGKTEMWYILKADKGSGIYCGFKRKTSREEFVDKVQNGEVEQLLNFIPVKPGDCYLIEAGTVHAIGAGCVICEIQQSSNVTYRVYDYNRKDAYGNLRELHLEKALDVINYSAFCDNTSSGEYQDCGNGKIRLLTECKYFRCRELLLRGEYADNALNSFVALNVLEGGGEINGQKFAAGDSFFVPCGEQYSINGNAKIILTDGGAV